MAWTLKFWKSSATPPEAPVTWNYGTGVAPSDVPSSQVTEITNYINSIAAVSTLAASRLNAYGQDIRIGYNSGNVGQAFRGPIDDCILIDLTAARTLYFFNSQGQLVPGDVRLTIMHELAYNYLPGNDPDRNATEAAMNGADFDFRGRIIDEQNAIAQNAGLANQIQTSYYAAFPSTDPLFNYFAANSSYSHGNTIDTTRLGTLGNDNIDHSNNTKLLTDLIFGLGGDDKLNGGKGSDYLYGGEDKDTFFGSDGDDLFHGGGTRNSTGGGVALDDDGEDTADYSAAAATEFIKITTDVTANTFHSGAIDAANRLLIQQTGEGNGTATIISVEKVKGTAGVDTFEVTQLVAAQLAGSDGKGGLAEVDLAGNDKPSVEGDLIDATKMKEKVVIDLDPANGFIQIDGQAQTKVKVLNAERAWGGEKDDKIKGNDEANELKGGKGEDKLEGRGGEDKLYGGEDKDELIGGAGSDELHGDGGIDVLDAAAGDGAADKLYGGVGSDKFKVDNGDTIYDMEAGDKVLLNNVQLRGGTQTTTGSSTYKGADGSTYTWTKGSTTLSVKSATGETITIRDFANGEGGIRLNLKKPDPAEPPCGCGGGPGGDDPGIRTSPRRSLPCLGRSPLRYRPRCLEIVTRVLILSRNVGTGVVWHGKFRTSFTGWVAIG